MINRRQNYIFSFILLKKSPKNLQETGKVYKFAARIKQKHQDMTFMNNIWWWRNSRLS